jgi:hypothetical protein
MNCREDSNFNGYNELFYLENSNSKDTSIESLKILLENILIEKCRRLDKNIVVSEAYESIIFMGSITYLNLKNAYKFYLKLKNKFYLKLKKENEKFLNLSSEGIVQNIIIIEEDTKCEKFCPDIVEQIKEICDNITIQSKVYEKIFTKGNQNCTVAQHKSFAVNLNSVKLNIYYVYSNDFKTEFKFIAVDDKIINSNLLKDEFETICKVLDSIITVDSCDMYLIIKEIINNFNYMSKLTKTDDTYSGFIEKGV